MEQVTQLFYSNNKNDSERIQLGKVSGSLWRKEELIISALDKLHIT